MAECHNASVAANIHGELTGGAILFFFNKLAIYLKSPATFVFVFDGPGRPKVKRDHGVKSSEPRWSKVVRELIQYFGYHVHQVSHSPLGRIYFLINDFRRPLKQKQNSLCLTAME